jgi:hypothetical protein
VRLGQVWRGRAGRWNVTTQHFHCLLLCFHADGSTRRRSSQAHRLTRVSSHPFQPSPPCHRNIPPSGLMYICTYTIVVFVYINHHTLMISIFVCNPHKNLKIRGLHLPPRRRVSHHGHCAAYVTPSRSGPGRASRATWKQSGPSISAKQTRLHSRASVSFTGCGSVEGRLPWLACAALPGKASPLFVVSKTRNPKLSLVMLISRKGMRCNGRERE